MGIHVHDESRDFTLAHESHSVKGYGCLDMQESGSVSAKATILRNMGACVHSNPRDLTLPYERSYTIKGRGHQCTQSPTRVMGTKVTHSRDVSTYICGESNG